MEATRDLRPWMHGSELLETEKKECIYVFYKDVYRMDRNKFMILNFDI